MVTADLNDLLAKLLSKDDGGNEMAAQMRTLALEGDATWHAGLKWEDGWCV